MERLGKYEELVRIGRGAMGVVYRSVDPWLGRTVAIKVMSADFEADDELLARFQREAQVAVQLKHPNIIEVFDGGVEQGRAYIAMEFLDGEDLKQILAEGDTLPLERQLQLVIQVCDALSYAHGKGVVHRDIKPGNIQITESGEVKILDFGLARITDSEMTATGMVMGTPNYMAPEQVEGEKVDSRADIFAVGSVFYEMLTGTKAFEAENMAAVLFAVTTRDPTPVHEVNPDVPEELSAVVARALEKRPEDRYAEIRDLQDAVEEAQELVAERRTQLQKRATERLDRLRSLRSEHADSLGLIAQARETEESTEQVEADVPAPVLQVVDAEDIETPDHYLGLARLCRTLGSMLDEAREYLSSLRLASALLDEATDLEAAGKPDRALEKAARVVADFPWHPRARDLEARLGEVVEASRREQADDMVRGAGELRERGELEAAQDELARALSLVPGHERATELRERIQQEIHTAQERERRAREASGHLDQARDALRTGEYDGARTAVLEALQVDPEVKGGRELLQQVEAAEAEEERRKLKEGALLEARRLRADDDLEAAIQKLGEVLELDPEWQEALQLRDELESEIAARERAQRLDRMLAEARSLAETRPEEARTTVREILDEEPGHADAREFLEDVEAEIDRRRADAEREERERAEEDRRRQRREAAERREREERKRAEQEAAVEAAAGTAGRSVEETSVLDAPDFGETTAETDRGVPASSPGEGWQSTVGSAAERARSAVSEHPRAAVAAAAALILALAFAALWDGGEEVGPATSGVLLLDASPWARVVEVRNASTGETWPLGSGGDAEELFTPVRLSLETGRWEVTLAHGEEQRRIQVEVAPGNVNRRRVQMGSVDLDGFLGTTGK